MKLRRIRRLSTPTLTLPHQGGGILRVIGQPPKGISEWYLSKPEQSMRLFLKNLQAIQAEQICRTPEELKGVRDNFEKRMKEAKK